MNLVIMFFPGLKEERNVLTIVCKIIPKLPADIRTDRFCFFSRLRNNF